MRNQAVLRILSLAYFDQLLPHRSYEVIRRIYSESEDSYARCHRSFFRTLLLDFGDYLNRIERVDVGVIRYFDDYHSNHCSKHDRCLVLALNFQNLHSTTITDDDYDAS